MKKIDIWKSEIKSPNPSNSIWFTDGKLKVFKNNKWEDMFKGEDIELPKTATVEKEGLVKKATKVAQLKKDATESEVINTVNAVIVKLQAAGLMA